jgi:isopenicillin-N N-acyltransferase-like protein
LAFSTEEHSVGKLIRLALVLVVGAAAALPPAALVIGHSDAIPPAAVETHGHLTVLHLRGAPYEMGYQHGAAQRAVIRQWLSDEIYRRAIAQDGQSHALLLIQAHELARGLPPEIQSELRGIADGAGLVYQDVLLLNLVLNRLPCQALLASETPLPPVTLNLEAQAFAAWPPATRQDDARDGTLLGYRLAAPGAAERLQRHLLVVMYQPAVGQSYATLAWSGQVGAWCGLNRAGLAVCATPVETVQAGGDSHQALFPPVLVRQLLAQAQDGEQALRLALQHDYLAAFHLLIADGPQQTVTAVSFGMHRYEIVVSQSGLMTWGLEQTSLESLLDDREPGWLDLDKALAVLSSAQPDAEGAAGICDPAALLNALFVPGRGELWLGLDLWPASCRRYLRLRLAG